MFDCNIFGDDFMDNLRRNTTIIHLPDILGLGTYIFSVHKHSTVFLLLPMVMQSLLQV